MDVRGRSPQGKWLMTLGVWLGGLVAAFVSIIPAVFVHIANYRHMRIIGWLQLWLLTAFVFYALGVYGTALLLQQTSRQDAKIEPAFLLLGSLVGPLISGAILLLSWLPKPLPFNFIWWSAVLFFALPFSCLGIHIACQFKRRRSHSNLKILCLRTTVPFGFTLMLIWLHFGTFPGAWAAAEVRQQWAYQEFADYDSIVQSIRKCPPILERVGTVQFVAPTVGKNYVVSEPGSSGHHGELTLEIVGETGARTAQFAFHISTHAAAGQLREHTGTTKISCNR